jgi:hypothetical protein
MAQLIKSQDPLKDALKTLGKHRLDWITKLRTAKDFGNVGDAFVGFEGNDPSGNRFCFRVDYDPTKQGHVNLTINNNEKYEYTGETQSWYYDVINNINGGAYCGVEKDSQGQWKTQGQETKREYIEGKKKYMKRFV